MKIQIIFLIGLLTFLPANANPLLGLPTLTIPADNLQTPAKIKLGHQLFLDKQLSADGQISCSTCHQVDKGFTDSRPLAIGINKQIGTRNSPTLINTAYFQQFFLDGRRDSLEQQVLDPFTNRIEHGLEKHQQIINIIQQDRAYQTQFKQVFASEVITIDQVAKSLASYLRTLIAGNSAFDRYLFGRDKTALTVNAARGLKIFRRKGNCANCHEISWDHALLTDQRYYNIGVGMQHLPSWLNTKISIKDLSSKIASAKLTVQQHAELGRFNVSHYITDIGKFKTPSLRNIALTAPYMHDGSLATLVDVIDYYNEGGQHNRFLDPAIFPLHLSTQDKIDLLEFLQALTSPIISH